MSAAAYKYDDLKDTSIRLLKIKPMTHSTCSKATNKDSSSNSCHCHVSCTLETFDDDIPPYRALSYCWGDTEHDRQLIYLGDTLIYVHKTLWEFLDQMQRSGETDTWFWTDCLCLNQGNKVEKSKQIPRMGDIYAKAKETISWLGCEAPSANEQDSKLGGYLKLIATRVPEAREVVQKFFEKLPNWTTIMSRKTSGLWPRSWQESDTEDLKEQQELKELEDKICRLGGVFGISLPHILELKYWTRVWIVQEVAMGKHVKLYYGPVSINLDDFFLAYKCHLYHLMKTSQGNTDVPAGTAVAIQARAAKRDNDISMHRVLEWGMLCESKYIHDRIYGLLGLLGSHDRQASSTFGSFKVDYEREITWVFWDVVFACRTVIKEDADRSRLIKQLLEIADFFPDLADSLRCPFSRESLLSYLGVKGNLSLHKEMTKRMISIFQSVGSGIFLSKSTGIYSDSTSSPSPSYLLESLRRRPNPDPNPDSKFQKLESYLATIFLECVDSGVDTSAELHAALIALRLAQGDDLGSGEWSCVPAQGEPGDDEKSGGKRKILEREIRWTRSVPTPSPAAAARCSLGKHATGSKQTGDHQCHGSSLYLNLADLGWNLSLDILPHDEKDEDWTKANLSIILNSTFSQPKYGHLIF